jgi:hypothetical protein
MLGVVGVDQPKPLDSNRRLQLPYQGVDTLRLREVHAGGMEVTGVQADAKTRVPVASIQHLGRLADMTGDRTGRSGGQLQQQIRSLRLRPENPA